MDGYLSKPIDVDDLIATVERFGGGGAAAPFPSPNKRRTSRPSTNGRRSAYAGGDRGRLTEVVSLFRSDYPSSLRKIDRALDRRDPEALRLAAHRLKGAIATVGAASGRQIAAELEETARAGDFDAASAHP